VLWGARLRPGDASSIPDGANVHLFVAAGEIDLRDAGVLHAGDAARLSRAGELALTAGPSGAEILVWVTS
jgi:quercetin 2,3-dioxygenase